MNTFRINDRGQHRITVLYFFVLFGADGRYLVETRSSNVCSDRNIYASVPSGPVYRKTAGYLLSHAVFESDAYLPVYT